MNTSMPFGFPSMDPSKLDPKVLMQLSQLIQELPPQHLSRMQTIMHNGMAGFDVRKEMEEFEKSLPPGFRERLLGIMGGAPSPVSPVSVAPVQETSSQDKDNMSIREARLTILRAVANGQMSPEEAEKLL